MILCFCCFIYFYSKLHLFFWIYRLNNQTVSRLCLSVVADGCCGRLAVDGSFIRTREGIWLPCKVSPWRPDPFRWLTQQHNDDLPVVFQGVADAVHAWIRKNSGGPNRTILSLSAPPSPPPRQQKATASQNTIYTAIYNSMSKLLDWNYWKGARAITIRRIIFLTNHLRVIRLHWQERNPVTLFLSYQ